jgi:hypothetical protein
VEHRAAHRVRVWRLDLIGFAMVVASSNNTAVQNVTDEIPAADAIDESWREQAAALDYLPKIAIALLTQDDPDDEPQRPGSGPMSRQGWALVAARLGKKANRGRFVHRFWYHTPDDPENANEWYGLLSVLKEYEKDGPDRSRSAAVADFRAMQARGQVRAGAAHCSGDCV